MPPVRPLRVLVLAALAWLVAHEAHAILWPGGGPGGVGHRGVHVAVLAIAALTGIAGAGRAPEGERLAWGLVAAGVTAWGFGEAWYTTVLWDDPSPPIPSPADAGFLAFPALTLTGVALLLRRRIHEVPRTLWADGVTVGLAAASVSAAIVMGAVLEEASGQPGAVAVAVAYPIADMLLLGLIAGALAGMGWRVDRRWLLLGAGVGVFALADSLYLVQAVRGTYAAGGWFDAGWWAGLLLIALASWAPATRVRFDAEAMRLIAVPLGFGVAGLGVLVAGTVLEVTLVAIALASASLVAVMARLMLTFRENVEILRRSRQEALTDPLTGLGNRRALADALERGLAAASDGDPLVLVLFDLDGFKRYNDTFGHPAGDALLVRLGMRLTRFLDGRGAAFRMGGDEFCALFRPGAQVAEPLIAGARQALSEHGEGFAIGCSHGAIVLPREAADAAEALRIADQRMYAHKHSGRRSPERQSADVLLRALSERHPDLGQHSDGVADLAEGTARALGLGPEQVRRVRHAAELHDVGKVAIPDSILAKPGPLDADEWAFMRRHTLIGERIISAAPALAPVAEIVRASHERWDGDGYPDRLARQAIPLGARIVAVADAFDAMTSLRPYGSPRPPAAALAELRRCAGSQFDPVVVEAFCAAVSDREAACAAA